MDQEAHSVPSIDGLALLAAQSRSGRSAIFQSKLRPALNPAYLVERPRLYTLLDQSTAAPLTLVVAPAGSGKSSLLRGWVAGDPAPARLALARRGRPRPRAAVARGVRGSRTDRAGMCGCRRRPVATSGRPARGRGGAARRPGGPHVRAAAVRHRRPSAGRRGRGGSGVARALRAAPAVLAARRDRQPPGAAAAGAPAAGPRRAGRGALLRAAFHVRRGVLDARATGAVARPRAWSPRSAARAGGWAASIQLAALSARASQARGGRDLPEHDSDGHYLEDYVWHEVLAPESAELVDVLLATSVVERVEPGLAQVLAERADAAELLARGGGPWPLHLPDRALRGLRDAPAGARGAAVGARGALARSGCDSCTAGRRGGTRRTVRPSPPSSTGCAPTGRGTRCGCSRPRQGRCPTVGTRARSVAPSGPSRSPSPSATSRRCWSSPGATCSSTVAGSWPWSTPSAEGWAVVLSTPGPCSWLASRSFSRSRPRCGGTGPTGRPWPDRRSSSWARGGGSTRSVSSPGT